ncbi:MAG: aldehyde dehydrogenase family protein, partial [Alphaproteobacteria bacterium]|nr:aldehyde dehydrogenase family protein [Alphaproteobacteria bacterium]
MAVQSPIPEPGLGRIPSGLYIGGQWQEAADGKRFESINPATGRRIGQAPTAGAADVDRAVKAAKQAFREWGRTPMRERAKCLKALAQRIRDNRESLALIDAVDSGNAIAGMRGDMDWTADTLDYFAGLVTEIKGETSSQGPRHLNFTRRQPYGVVAKINPFNHPFRFCVEKAAA